MCQNKMKKIILLTALFFIGCDTNQIDNSVQGEWEGVLLDNTTWIAEARLRIEGGSVIGDYVQTNKISGIESPFVVTGELLGNQDQFTAHLNIGTHTTWPYIGHIDNAGRLCLLRRDVDIGARCLDEAVRIKIIPPTEL